MKPILLFTAIFTTAAAAAAQPLVVMHPLKFEHFVLPTVSARQQMSGLPEGRVSVAVQCDTEGRPADWLLLAYSNTDLARCTVEAVRQWRFAPVQINGQPAGGQRVFEFEFKGPDVVSYATPMDQLEVMFHRMGLGRLEFSPCPLRDLDRIPLPLNAVAPVYPRGGNGAGIRGAVEVRFYIDEKGEVRLPAVISADYVELAEAALAAVRQWKFEAPTSRGAPVLIVAQQHFDFAVNQSQPDADPQPEQPTSAKDQS